MKHPFEKILLYYLVIIVLITASCETEKSKSINENYYSTSDSINLFIDSTKSLLKNHPEQAINLIERILDSSTHEINDTNRAILLSNLGNAYKNVSNYTKAIEKQNQSLKINLELKLEKSIATNYGNLSKVYQYIGMNDEAERYLEKAYKIFKELGSSKDLINIYNSYGSLNLEKGLLKEALDYYYQSLNLAIEEDDREGQAMIKHNLAIIHAHLKEYDLSMEEFKKALEINEKMGKNHQWVINNLMAISEVYIFKDSAESAIPYLEKAVEKSKTLGSLRSEALCYNLMADVYIELKDYDRAEQKIKDGLEIRKQINDKKGSGNSYLSLAHLYLKQSLHQKAIQQALIAKDLFNEVEASVELKSVHNLLAEIYETTGNFKKAFIHQKHYSTLHEEILNSEKIKALEQLKTQFEVQEKDREIISKNKSIKANKELLSAEKKQNKILYLLIFSIGLVLLFTILMYAQKRKINKLLSLQRKSLQEDLKKKNTILNELYKEKSNVQVPTTFEQLTKREIEVLTYLCMGLSDKEIAEALFVSVPTIKSHLRNIYPKLGVSKRSEAIALVNRVNWLKKDE